MTKGETFETADEARRYAFANKLEFDNQDDWCDICEAYHVGINHDAAVPDQCGFVSIQGFNTVLECKRAKGHPPDHHDDGITSWTVTS